MSKELDDLKKNIEGLSDSKLLLMLANHHEYRPEALKIARAEVVARGLDDPDAEAVKEVKEQLAKKAKAAEIRAEREKACAAQKEASDERLASLWYGLLLGIFSLGSAFLFIGNVSESVQLRRHGVETVGIVQEYSMRLKQRKNRTRIYHDHAIEFDGMLQSKDLGSEYDIGAAFRILYMPEDPSKFRFGSREQTLISLLSQEYGWWGLVFPCLAISAGYGSFWMFRNIFRVSKA